MKKKKLLTIALIVLPTICLATSLPLPPSINDSLPISSSSIQPNSMRSAENRNYIRIRTMLKSDCSDYMDVVQYYDGLGRKSHTVEREATPTGQNLISLHEYDTQHRLVKNWLPLPSAAEYMLPEDIYTAAKLYSDDSRPFTTTTYEPSPMGRVSSENGPGGVWARNPVKYDYAANDNYSDFKCLEYFLLDEDILYYSRLYPSDQLYIERRTDENGHTSMLFTNNEGRVILSRIGGYLDTYYVYDNNGNLCYVLPPMVKNDLSKENLDLYAFRYKYDIRNRCIWKKLPGTEHIEYVYDNVDRMIFSQDGKQRAAGKWTYYLYDKLNRITEQGECMGKNPANATTIHIKNYYDHYDFMQEANFMAIQPLNQPVSKEYTGKSKLTGSVTTAWGSDTKIYTLYYYSQKGLPESITQSNLLGGYNRTEIQYTFTDKPNRVIFTHTASGKPQQKEVYTYTYDHAERLSKVEHMLNGTQIPLAEYTYDETGRLSNKAFHNSQAGSIAYVRNIRNWLTNINSIPFTQELNYYTDFSTTRYYNGNISSMKWTANGKSYKFSFRYDEIDRLRSAYSSLMSGNPEIPYFCEEVTGYDLNGNITGLKRYGQITANTYGLIDNLTFTLNGNQLNRVDDAATASAYNNGFEFKDAVKQANEYAYDANGNLTKDLNKGITGIQYNFLNLPSSITFSDGSTVAYTYSADGTKLRTVHKISGVTTTTDYCGNVIYENGVQKLLLTEEGYVSLNDKKYHYFLKDHQGNNRVVVNQAGEVEETNHYYPFGGIFASSTTVQPYKYNDKELDTKKGLNWYDYGARHYDAMLGRWHAVDAMAEKHYEVAPYAYCGNSPVTRIDPDGNDWRVQTRYNNETDKIEYHMTVNAVLYNNSSNRSVDMEQLASNITQQVNAAYTISERDFVSNMNFNLRVVNSMDDIKKREHVIQMVDQERIGSSSPTTRGLAYTIMNSLDIKVGTVAVTDMLNGNDNRTIAHEIGHTGGLEHETKLDNLMTQKKEVQRVQGDFLRAIQLNHSQVRTIRDNYIHDRLNKRIP